MVGGTGWTPCPNEKSFWICVIYAPEGHVPYFVFEKSVFVKHTSLHCGRLLSVLFNFVFQNLTDKLAGGQHRRGMTRVSLK